MTINYHNHIKKIGIFLSISNLCCYPQILHGYMWEGIVLPLTNKSTKRILMWVNIEFKNYFIPRAHYKKFYEKFREAISPYITVHFIGDSLFIRRQ